MPWLVVPGPSAEIRPAISARSEIFSVNVEEEPEDKVEFESMVRLLTVRKEKYGVNKAPPRTRDSPKVFNKVNVFVPLTPPLSATKTGLELLFAFE